MKHTLFTIFVVTTLLFTACKTSKYADLGDGIYADIQTNKGDIVVKLHHEQTPVTVANFVSLAEGTNPFVSDKYKDKKYYDGLTFHRVMKDFMIQGGDPEGTGAGNPGYKFFNEFVDSLSHSKKGILAMANSGFETNGSQFYITHKATPWLDGFDQDGNPKNCETRGVSCHTVFGEVVKGIEVVDSIANVKVVPRNKPEEDVVMNTVEIIRNGKAAKKFDAVEIMTTYFDNEPKRLEEKKRIAAEKKAAFEQLKQDMTFDFIEQKAVAKTTASGLKIYTLTEGKGEKPKVGQSVQVFYAGYLTNGNLFDSNYEDVARKYNTFNPQRKAQGGYNAVPMPYSPDAQLIPGFKEGLMTMKVGDKVRLFIPPHLGYGEQGAGTVIPPNSDLVFDLEIAGIQQ